MASEHRTKTPLKQPDLIHRGRYYVPPKPISPIYASLAPKPKNELPVAAPVVQRISKPPRVHLGSEYTPVPGASLLIRNLSNKGRKLNRPRLVPHPISIPPRSLEGGSRKRSTRKRSTRKRSSRKRSSRK